jgi:hypothetical protein
MKTRLPFLAAAALLGLTALAGPAFAIQNVYVPDPNQPQNGGPPDALFDKSVPAEWQQKTDNSQSSSSLSRFHFSVGSGNGDNYQSTTQNFGENANVPLSEFKNNGVPLSDPYFPR